MVFVFLTGSRRKLSYNGSVICADFRRGRKPTFRCYQTKQVQNNKSIITMPKIAHITCYELCFFGN